MDQQYVEKLERELEAAHDQNAEMLADITEVAKGINGIIHELDLPPGIFNGTVSMASVIPSIMTKFMSGMIDTSKINISALTTIGEKYKHLADE